MSVIDSIEALEALYGPVSMPAQLKVADRLVPAYRRWIEASRFCVVASVGPEGTDASPRGDPARVVEVADERTILLPDWRGNNRIDTLRNIVRDGRVSLLFMVAGSDIVVRVNGTARLSADRGLTGRFVSGDAIGGIAAGTAPTCVIAVTVGEVYGQCPKALARARLWHDGDLSQGLPTIPEMLKDARAAAGGAG